MKRAALAAVAILALTACGPEPWDNPTNRDPRVAYRADLPRLTAMHEETP